MTPIQQLMLGAGGKADPIYMDDVFSTYLYKGNGMSQTITNGIDLSGEGGLVWQKTRTNASGSTTDHVLTDTVRGYNKQLITNSNAAQTTDTSTVASFASTGFGLGQSDTTNNHVNTYASWTFRKSPAFTICTWNGNETAGRQISHDLNSIPGCIIVKCTSDDEAWHVYHRGVNGGVNPEDYVLRLNMTNAQADTADAWNDTAPTSTHFTVGNSVAVNGDSEHTYVAYVFAGGESTAATARSVDFDGTGDYLSVPASSDFSFGTGDFTIEGWIYKDTNSHNKCIFTLGDTGTTGGSGEATSLGLNWSNSNRLIVFGDSNYIISNSAANNTAPVGQWIHFALVKNSGVLTLYTNGVSQASYNSSQQWGAGSSNYLTIGATKYDGAFSNEWNGHISNFRVIKGTALYTSSFRPPTEPLTNVTNTKLLCCNDSSTTGSTVTSGTITANGDPTASTDSPFDDPAGFKFGDAGDQNVIKCGSYEGNNADDGVEVYLGWEPSFLFIKSADTSDNWVTFDNLRGLTVDGIDDKVFFPNTSAAEESGNYLTPTPTGFKLTSTTGRVNSASTYTYLAIRRSDGYCGKPPELGTDVFAMDTGAGSSTIPNFDSGFPVDFGFYRETNGTSGWEVGARLLQGKYLYTDRTNAEGSWANIVFDSNTGWQNHSNHDSDWQSWNWKRGTGFDVVTFKGDGVSGRQISHSMNKIPEMIWLKNRSNAADWMVGHKGLDGGTNPWTHYLNLNTTAQELDETIWADMAPSSTHFSVGNFTAINNNAHDYIAMLFASVDGISKVGSFNGSSSSQTITTGFQPRFLIVRRTDQAGMWHVLDTLRGWGSGNDQYLALESTSSQTAHDFGAPTSTGFTLTSDSGYNGSGGKYIYYAHA